MSSPKTDPPLPTLREIVTVHHAPRNHRGWPTWTLYDPIRHQHHALDWPQIEVLKRIGDPEIDTAQQVAERVTSETTLTVTPAEVTTIVKALHDNRLVIMEEYLTSPLSSPGRSTGHSSLTTQLLHTYLFFRIPLVMPDHVLNRIVPWIGWIFSGPFLLFMSLLSLPALYLVGRQWEGFLTTFPHLFSWQGATLYGVAIILVKSAHELGHAIAAKRYGCTVPTMGVAFLVMLPVLYSDVSDVWKLPDRRHRLLVDAGGMIVELMMAVVALLAWSFLPDGPVRSTAFFVATTSIVMTLLVNLSPFLRFDGYFLLSDWVNISNLHRRAAGMGRWWLRTLLFGWNMPSPEPSLSQGWQRFLILFAYTTWLYRLVLFIGIALLVYHLFFKLLGLFLFTVEIYWFILLPIGREVRTWMDENTPAFTLNIHTLITATLLTGILLWLILPRSVVIIAPAALIHGEQQSLFTQVAGRIATINTEEGARVTQGKPLITFTAPDLEHHRFQIERTIDTLRWRLNHPGHDNTLLQQRPIIARELHAALTERRGVEEQQSTLTVRAPFDGIVVSMTDTLRIGDWIAEKSRLLDIVQPTTRRIDAFIKAESVSMIQPGSPAVFFPEMLERLPLDTRITGIDTAGIRNFPIPWLTSEHGGEIAVRRDHDGQLIPEASLYRATFSIPTTQETIQRPLRGTIHLTGSEERPILAVWRRIVAVMVRESGL
ncbi:MAG: HlyD family efflux transporter periplasmic adaptor subunit [Magnetococcales bacterium]|nr:HlyD family efflux transporter periplasmic adaptor subunit [Magnetococcales bacterium]